MRPDGREPHQLRPVTIDPTFVRYPEGSVLYRAGDTMVLCSVSVLDRTAPFLRGSGVGWVTAEYAMLPRATETRSEREVSHGRPSGRSHEIQRLVGRSLRGVVDLGALGGEATVTVDCDVLQADGGTRTAAITGAYLAVYDALARWREAGKVREMPSIGAVAAVSVGVVDGTVLLDLDYSEDHIAEVDMNVVMDGRGRFLEVQGTAESAPFDRARLDEMLQLAESGVGRLLAIQGRVIAEGLVTYAE